MLGTDRLESDNVEADMAEPFAGTANAGGDESPEPPDASLLPDARSTPTLQEAIIDRERSSMVPGSPDFLMSYSTLPGSVSYRDSVAGSLYIKALNDNLRKNLEIDRALKLVTNDVKKQLKERRDTVERFQLPFHLTSGMDKLIYL